MNRKSLATCIFISVLCVSNECKSDTLNYDYYGATSSEIPGLPTFNSKELNSGFKEYNVYLINSETKETLQVSGQFPDNTGVSPSGTKWQVDPATKKLYIQDSEGSDRGIFHVLDPISNTWTKECVDDATYTWSRACDYKITDGGFDIDTTSNTSLSVGDPNSPTVINSNGISGIITRDSSTGITKIGQNSLNFQEFSGSQPLKLWGTNTSGKTVPINIIDKLLINGRDVEQSINNVGAMSAALTGLPTVPTETTLACGLGTGTHGGDFAFSGGCASKVNEKLSINYAASMTMPGQDYAGDFEDKFSARAGFVWKLGKAIKPTQISMKAKEKMEVKINSLEDKNKRLENTVSTLVSKLERLEKIALKEIKSKDLAIYKLK